MHKKDDHEDERDPEWQHHGELAASPDLARCCSPHQKQRNHNKYSDRIPNPPGPPVHETSGPGDDPASEQACNPPGSPDEATNGSSQHPEGGDIASLVKRRWEAHNTAHQTHPRQCLQSSAYADTRRERDRREERDNGGGIEGGPDINQK